MTRIDAKALGEIEALVEERKKFEKWISALAERRSITPNHVFQRVLNDYEERMRVVSADLSGRASIIEASIHHLREQLASLQQEEMAITDERAEAELRAAVGEYSPDKWEEVRRVADENIARLSGKRMEFGGELAHLEGILAVAMARPATAPAGLAQAGSSSGAMGGAPRGSGGGAPPPPREPAAPPAAPKPEPAPIAARQPIESPPSVTAMPSPATGFDELAFLSSVVETEIGHLSAQPADLPRQRSTNNTASAPAPRQSIVEHDVPLDLVIPAPAPAAAAPAAAPASGNSRMGRSATPMISESLSGDEPENTEMLRASSDESSRGSFDRRLSGSVPAYLKDVSKEATKSLKCQECGTMNYPTEWYCERCGGELAAL